MKLFGREVLFASPLKCNIVIFDECNSHIVRSVINTKYSIGVWNMRPEDIFVGANIIGQFLKELSQFNITESRSHPRGLIFGIIHQCYLRYIKVSLELMRPKAVITFIDNSNTFGWMAKNCDKFPFIAIQNGSRLSYAASPNSEYYVPHYFCFGEHEQNLFPKLAYKVDHFYPVGSLVASLNLLPEEQVEEKYDLLVVSTWRGDIGFEQEVQDTMRSMKIMDQYLAKYLNEHDIKAALIYRAERDSEHWSIPEIGLNEEEYYQKIYDNSIEYIETDSTLKNIFPLMQQSHMIVSCLSTAAIEAFGLYKKILYCNFTNTDLYHQDIDDSILTTNSDYSDFSKNLTALFQQDQEEYIKDHKEKIQYYMNFGDDPRSVSTQISKKIDTIVKNFK